MNEPLTPEELADRLGVIRRRSRGMDQDAAQREIVESDAALRAENARLREALKEQEREAARESSKVAVLRDENTRLREALNTLLDEFEGEPVYRHHRGKYEEWQVAPEAIDDARRAVGRAALHPEEGSSG